MFLTVKENLPARRSRFICCILTNFIITKAMSEILRQDQYVGNSMFGLYAVQ